MKKSLILFVLGISMAMSCQLNELEIQLTEGETFYASIEDNGVTRTTLDENNNVLWSENDQISIFRKSTINSKYQVTPSSAGQNTGIFTKVYTDDDFKAGMELDHNVALYPYLESARLSKRSVSSYELTGISLPKTQVYVKNSFALENFPMVAVADDTELIFWNVCGGIKLQLKGSQKVSSIKIEGNNNEKLSGDATLTIYSDNSIPSVSMSVDASSSVVLDCGSGIQLNESSAIDFIITLPPLTFTEGFIVSITDSDNESHVIETSKCNQVIRSSLLIMPEISLKGNSSDSESHNGYYIDEYGINHGLGVEIDGIVWAPVNCGYHETDYPYGKLYQWGRKYGQGYDENDATYPSVEEGTVIEGPISFYGGQSEANKDVFFIDNDFMIPNWVIPADATRWNIGSESSPEKNINYDPCPNGWRVPTFPELTELITNYSDWTSNDIGQKGIWFSGTCSYTEDIPQVFFPAAGDRDGNGNSFGRDHFGNYWSSKRKEGRYTFDATHLSFYKGHITFYDFSEHTKGFSVRCVRDLNSLDVNGEDVVIPESIPVLSLPLSPRTINDLCVGDKAKLIAKVAPIDATDQTIVWSSDSPTVAIVNQDGEITAVSEGTATISAEAGGFVSTCRVSVTNRAVASTDYKDEYGINHGKGIAIGKTVWAPVNCGYKAVTIDSEGNVTDEGYPYGKLYQWGRKYGQGYSGLFFINNYSNGEIISDATYPSIEGGTIKEGGISLVEGQSEANKDVFFLGCEDNDNNWVCPYDETLWNIGTESAPEKNKNYDPCPEGWRVPTHTELITLCQNKSSWTTNDDQAGLWLCGASSYTKDVPQVFFPAAGCRYNDGKSNGRGARGYYWSSSSTDDNGQFRCISIHDYFAGNCLIRSLADGQPIRCVQE